MSRFFGFLKSHGKDVAMQIVNRASFRESPDWIKAPAQATLFG